MTDRFAPLHLLPDRPRLWAGRHACLAALLAALLLLVPARAAWAQEAAPDEVVRIELVDGSTLIGTVERETAEAVFFRTTAGVEMMLGKDQIRSREVLQGRMVDGRFQRVDPNRTRLFFAPTARPLGAGQGYFADYQIFFPFVAAGVGDRVSLAGGFSLIPGSPAQVVYAAPKVTLVHRPGASVAVGGLVGTALGGEVSGEGYAGLAFGVGTFGSSRRAVTVGGGFAFAGAEGESATSAPILLVGGEYQVSGSIKLLSENYVYVGEGATVVFSGGVRFFNETLAADLGLFSTPEAFGGGGFPFIPWVGFAYNFGW